MSFAAFQRWETFVAVYPPLYVSCLNLAGPASSSMTEPSGRRNESPPVFLSSRTESAALFQVLASSFSSTDIFTFCGFAVTMSAFLTTSPFGARTIRAIDGV